MFHLQKLQNLVLSNGDEAEHVVYIRAGFSFPHIIDSGHSFIKGFFNLVECLLVF